MQTAHRCFIYHKLIKHTLLVHYEYIGMTGGMARYWIIPWVGDKELPRVGH